MSIRVIEASSSGSRHGSETAVHVVHIVCNCNAILFRGRVVETLISFMGAHINPGLLKMAIWLPMRIGNNRFLSVESVLSLIIVDLTTSKVIKVLRLILFAIYPEFSYSCLSYGSTNGGSWHMVHKSSSIVTGRSHCLFNS